MFRKLKRNVQYIFGGMNAKAYFQNTAIRLNNIDDTTSDVIAVNQNRAPLLMEARQAIEALQGKVVLLEERSVTTSVNSVSTTKKSFNFVAPAVAREEALYKPVEGSWLDGAGNPTFTNMELESGRLIASLVALYRCQSVLETGTHCGYSASVMAQAMLNMGIDGHIWTFDPFNVSHVFDDPFLQKYVTWINDFSFNFRDHKIPQAFDMLLLDSDHSYKTLASEVELFEPKLRNGGLMVFHDTIVFKDLWPVVESVKASGRYEVITLETPRTWANENINGSGITICRKIASGDPIAVEEQYFDNARVESMISRLGQHEKRLATRSFFFQQG